VTVKERLIKARNFLKRHKWGKGHYHDPLTDRYCAIGALRALEHDVEDWDVTANAEMVLNAATEGGSIILYNDLPATKKRDIISAYDRAIKAS